jgi:hypothetical protein
MNNDQTEQTIARATAAGWQIVSRDAGGIQFRKPKQWSKGAVITGCVLVLFWGFGLIVLALAGLDYLIAKDRLAYMTAGQLAAGRWPEDKPAGTSMLAKGLAVLLLVIVGLAILGVALGG